MVSVVLVALLSANPSCGCVCESSERSAAEVSGNAQQAQSKNFQVTCYALCADARAIARTCEQWRNFLRKKWLDARDASSWDPRCVVVVHSRRDTYLAAVGRSGERSFGSTWIDVRNQKICGRRIDLLTDETKCISALGHELTHAVIADAFPGKQPPPWANEGMALLADSLDKQERHQRDADVAIRSRNAFHVSELLALGDYPRPERIPAFYGQSVSLVKLLCRSGKPHQIVTFVKQVEETGCDEALRRTYGIHGLAELQRLCDKTSTSPSSAALGVVGE